ncbi:MAG: DUF3343 domain-containing protein [Clostridia bacterium]|nr:DUF3343 domain-containing protein [Clostridia bacterium]
MIKKKLRLVVTFRNTALALAMESKCKEKGMEGRMIPVPSSISAGCGLSWCAPVEMEEEYRAFIEQENLEVEGIHQCML